MPVVLLCVFSVHVKAASLFGKVVEVKSGDVITVFNLNRPVRVSLLGVDAPELNQAFGDVAKQHLADLVLEKSVIVEYSGIAGDGSLSGRVLLNNADIGAQMIRDGVAWFDPNNQNRLSVTDREVYQQSEAAARGERRGLWQEANPTAPWEFVKAATRKQNQTLESSWFAGNTKPKGPRAGLDNLTLMVRKGTAGGSSTAGSPDDHAWIFNTAKKNWHVYQPDGQNFSVLVPEDGQKLTESVLFEDEVIELKSYRVRDGYVFYYVDYVTTPTRAENGQYNVDRIFKNFLRGAIERYELTTGEKLVNCDKGSKKNVSMNGFAGMEYDLPNCPAPTRARIFTKVNGNQRTIYIASVVFLEKDPNVDRFLQSFTAGLPKKDLSRKDAKAQSLPDSK